MSRLNTSYPDEDKVNIENGVVSFSFMSSKSVLGVCGWNDGWFKIDGICYYVASRFRLEDGQWSLNPEHWCVNTVDLEKNCADKKAPEEIKILALKILDETFKKWLDDRKDIAAEVEQSVHAYALQKVRDDIKSLERQLKDLKADLPRLEEEYEKAKNITKREKTARKRRISG